MNALDLITCLIAFATSGRLMFYQRRGRSFKRHISALAYLMIVATGALALSILTGRISTDQINPIFIIALALLCIAVFRSEGNVAQMIRATRALLKEVAP